MAPWQLTQVTVLLCMHAVFEKLPRRRPFPGMLLNNVLVRVASVARLVQVRRMNRDLAFFSRRWHVSVAVVTMGRFLRSLTIALACRPCRYSLAAFSWHPAHSTPGFAFFRRRMSVVRNPCVTVGTRKPAVHRLLEFRLGDVKVTFLPSASCFDSPSSDGSRDRACCRTPDRVCHRTQKDNGRNPQRAALVCFMPGPPRNKKGKKTLLRGMFSLDLPSAHPPPISVPPYPRLHCLKEDPAPRSRLAEHSDSSDEITITWRIPLIFFNTAPGHRLSPLRSRRPEARRVPSPSSPRGASR